MKPSDSPARLGALEKLLRSYDASSRQEKRRLLSELDGVSLGSAQEVLRLHDALCFICAYPDSPAVYRRVDDMLNRFQARADFRRHRRALSDTGIAGTAIHYRFHWKTAQWLYERWPGALAIDWAEFGNVGALEDALPTLLPAPALETLEHTPMSPREWISALKREGETDADCLLRMFARWPVSEAVREKFFDHLDVPLSLRPAPGTPSRTSARLRTPKPFVGAPCAPAAAADPPRLPAPQRAWGVGPAQGRALIDLARVQMVTRGRDLYAFMNADPRDVGIVTFDGGIQFLSFGLQPEARPLIEALYVFLVLKNGVPVGYTQAATLFRSAEINFNVFDTFRGAEASTIFRMTLAMVRRLFGCDAFTVNTQQLGEGNDEALRTGAFWFYYKHGFRPRDAGVRAAVRRELAEKRRNRGHRSDRGTLLALAADDLYLFTGKPREDLVNRVPGAAVGLAAAQVLESRASASDPTGAARCIREASSLLGRRIDSRASGDRRQAWERWAPVVLALPGVRRWSAAGRRALAEVIDAKGGRRETKFVALFDRHRTLRRAVLRLAADVEQGSYRPAAADARPAGPSS